VSLSIRERVEWSMEFREVEFGGVDNEVLSLRERGIGCSR
jgi:hypothetical protein